MSFLENVIILCIIINKGYFILVLKLYFLYVKLLKLIVTFSSKFKETVSKLYNDFFLDEFSLLIFLKYIKVNILLQNF
jgi:hypothetical protein